MKRVVGLISLVACSSTSPDAPAFTADAPKHFAGLASTRWVESLAYADGSTLWAASEDLVGGADGEARAFSTGDGSTKVTVAGPSWSVAVSSSGGVAVGGNVVSLVDPKTGQSLRTFAGASGAVAFSPDGKLVAASAATGQVIVYSTVDGSTVAQVAHPIVLHERIWKVVFSPDGSLLVTASGQNGLGSPHGTTYVWRTKDWSQAAAVTCQAFDAAFSPDGSKLALACWLDARLLSTTDFSVQKTFPLLTNTLAMSVAWSPDGTKVAVGGLSAGVQTFRSDGTALRALTDAGKAPTIKGLAWSPDGKWIAGGGWDDAVVRVWPAP